MIRKLVFLLLVATSVAFAQRPDTASVCWRPRRLANCKTWVVTEAAVETPVSSTSRTQMPIGYSSRRGRVSNDFEPRLAFTIGLMKNSEANSAFGFGMAMVNDDLPGRIEARYRRWLDPETGIDFGLGYTGARVRIASDRDHLSTHGVTGSLGITGTYFGADGRFDYARTATNRPVHAAFLTIRTGSRAGPIVTASGLLVLMGLYATIANSRHD